jgi:protein-tyrosine phosphatase
VRKLLFLCTANYYRSRFAEIVFNKLAREAGLDWVAFSRAVAIEQGERWNVGPISVHTREACRVRGIEIPEPMALPRQARDEDFAEAGRVIALKEAEHRPYIEQRFATWQHRVEYWHVHDLDGARPEQACGQIERNVAELVAELARGESQGGRRGC